jgi:hypothetical protein
MRADAGTRGSGDAGRGRVGGNQTKELDEDEVEGCKAEEGGF